MKKTSIKKVKDLDSIFLFKNKNRQKKKNSLKKLERDFFKLCLCQNLINNKKSFYKLAKYFN